MTPDRPYALMRCSGRSVNPLSASFEGQRSGQPWSLFGASAVRQIANDRKKAEMRFADVKDASLLRAHATESLSNFTSPHDYPLATTARPLRDSLVERAFPITCIVNYKALSPFFSPLEQERLSTALPYL